MFLTKFSICLLVSTFTVAILLLIKKVFRNQLSAKWQYNIWFLLLVAMALPFIPSQWIDIGEKFILFDWNPPEEMNTTAIHSSNDHLLNEKNWIQDFTVSVNHSTSDILNMTIGILWLTGIMISAIFVSIAWLQLRKIKRSVSKITQDDYLSLFEQAKQRLNISKQLIIGESPLVNSPMTFGIFQTYIVLPVHFDKYLTKEEVNYIFLHELNHFKFKDILSNYCIVIFQALYWFNPLVWYAFKEMRLDREIACDIAVLKLVNQHLHTAYGKTILRFANHTSIQRSFSFVNQLNGSKKQLTKRIKNIASFQSESKLLKLKSIIIFLLVGVFVMIQIPFVSAMAADNNQYHFDNKHTEYIDLVDYFSGYKGSFVLYDMQADQFRIYNEKLSTTRVSPDSTYKIYSALLSLESNIISPNNSLIKWDGTTYDYKAWNQNQDLNTAMTYSVNWYFQELDRRLKIDTIQAFLKNIKYGNQDLSGGIDQYWLESSLRISPVEQVQLLNVFYSNEFGWKEKNIQSIKSALKLEEKDNAVLYGKTGTGTVNGQDINGWFIGFVETNDNTYIFATNIQNEINSNGSNAVEITLEILKDFGIYR
ncbi:BlaR1 family beta-lactam sensor/signal transducer [Ornithinibacillus bavariensis]|uniref:BlaR1 family beta-lactam sensor/signal transducer n=1 Tax=Ornithinibacillus bavariensis TaxID=545502 RepID=UPI001BB3CCC3|nr:BlaR1 family beta-lactam sensor/signal transducer [Ornithinibacillus bavariensis]